MTEIWFYHLQRQPLEKALPQILENRLKKAGALSFRPRAMSGSTRSIPGSGLIRRRVFSRMGGQRWRWRTPAVYLTTGLKIPMARAEDFRRGAEMAPALAEPDAPMSARSPFSTATMRTNFSTHELSGKRLRSAGFGGLLQQSENGRWKRRPEQSRKSLIMSGLRRPELTIQGLNRSKTFHVKHFCPIGGKTLQGLIRPAA